MKLTASKVAKMIETAERNGFSKESVYKAINSNKALVTRADGIASSHKGA